MSDENPKAENHDPAAAAKSGLSEYIDIKFCVEKLETPADEKRLFDVLVDLPSVRNLSVAKGEVILEYEPVILSKEHLVEAVSGAGFTIAETESAPASILTDALSNTEPNEPAPNDPREDVATDRSSRNGVVSRS